MDWLDRAFWLFVIVVALSPLIQHRILQVRRAGGLQRLGRARGSRAIALIHRRETWRLLGIPVLRRDEIDAPEAVLRAIARCPPATLIDLILHTPPGASLAAEQIAHALIRHPARSTVLVPHYALGDGTIIALAAEQLILDPNAVLGPLDPRIGPYPAASLLALPHFKPLASLDDRTLALLDQARKAVGQVRALVGELLIARGAAPEAAARIAGALTGGGWTPHYPILIEEARRLGLEVGDALPPEVHALMELYDPGTPPRPSTASGGIDAHAERGTRNRDAGPRAGRARRQDL